MAEARTTLDQGAIRITGKLSDDATLAYTAENPPKAVLSLAIKTAKGRPFVVLHVLGTDPNTHLAAQAKLRVLKRGDEVAVYAHGLLEQSDHGVASLRAVGVTHVLPISSALTRKLNPATTEEG